jgi:hypothetical protein
MGCFTPDVPEPTQVGGDYLGMIGQFARGMPILSGVESAFKPGFVNTGLNSTNQSIWGTQNAPGLVQNYNSLLPVFAAGQVGANSLQRAGNVADVQAFGTPGAEAVRNMNPLMASINRTAQQGLDMGGQLMPQDVNRITNQVRGDWSNRGLGGSPAAQLGEAMELYGAGENARQARQSFASQAAGLNNQLALPALSMVTERSTAPADAMGMLTMGSGFGQNAGPTLIPGAQNYDILNTAYNAQAAANIAAANNRAGIMGGALSY